MAKKEKTKEEKHMTKKDLICLYYVFVVKENYCSEKKERTREIDRGSERNRMKYQQKLVPL